MKLKLLFNFRVRYFFKSILHYEEGVFQAQKNICLWYLPKICLVTLGAKS